MLFILSAAFIPFFGYLKGEEHATKKKEEFQGCEIEKLYIEQKCAYILKNKNIVLAGLVIEKTLTTIALWDGTKTIIHPLKDKTIEIRFGQKQQESEEKE